MSDDKDHLRGGDAGTERALDEMRLALDGLAARMDVGLREDLADLRAIAASVAERDLTADVEALRVDVASLVGRGAESGVAQVLARFDALEARLDRLDGADSTADILARLHALTARLDSLPTAQQIANLSGDLRAHLADALAGFDGDRGSLLEDLQDNLADVASGQVVGALWDEVRQLRTDLPDLVVGPEPIAPAPAPAPVAPEPDPQLTALTDELAVLRSELAEGLVVEPSDALSASLDALKGEVDGLRDAIGDLRSTPVPASDPQPAPAGSGRPDEADIDAIADQVAALRDFVATELDTVRQAVSARLDAAAEATAGALAARPEPAPAPAVQGALDQETIEVLRDEIRASGAIADQVVDALREELKALRRRIAVKASERVLDDQQLAQIADAVAVRLAEDREQG